MVLRGERISNDPDLLDNLQAWYENEYNTRLLHSNLSFPLLKKLTEAGDPQARKAFKDEVASRYDTGVKSVRKFLEQGNYLRFLTKEVK